MLNRTSELHEISVHVTCGRGSVIICTFGFVDDVVLLHNLIGHNWMVRVTANGVSQRKAPQTGAELKR